MPSLNIEQFGDLLTVTLPKFERVNYVSLITDLQEFPAATSLLRKTRMNHSDGHSYQFRVKTQTGQSYRHIAITTPDQVNMYDGFTYATIQLRKSETKYAFYEEEMDLNQGESRLIDLIKSKEHDCDFDFIEGIENDWWRFPSASDPNAPLSLPYWVTKNATVGFNGGIPTGYSDVAGLSPTTYSRWNNYSGNYTAVSLDDLILKMRDMADKTFFVSPVKAMPELGKPGDRSYYTTLSVRRTFENVVDSRNDNLGPDVAKNDGKVLFRGMPVEWVPRLDEDTTNPIYQIPWNVFKMIVVSGWWQRRKVLAPYPGQRNVVGVFKDTIKNFCCYNRRACGVLATGVTYP